MNNKGQVFLNIIIAIFVWIGGIFFVPLMEDIITGNRTALNCAVPVAITDGTKLLCLINDIGVIIIIWTVIVIVFSVLLGKGK